MGNNQRRIQLPPDALAKHQQERAEHIDGHLTQWGNITNIQNQAMDQALNAELSHSGVPADETAQDEIIERCKSFAEKVAFERLHRYNNGVKEICELLNVRDLPDFVTWAALKAGKVQLPVTEELPAEEKKLITEH